MIVPTRRAVLLLACLAPVGLLGYVTPLALDVLVVLNVGLLVLIVVDGRMAVAPARLDVVREGAESFTDWVTGTEAQAIIGEYGAERFGEALFTPNAS